MRRGKKLYVILGVVYLLVWVIPADADLPEWAKLVASDGAAGDWFGYSVSISGDYALVGGHDNDNGVNSGSAYIFKRSGLSWSKEAKLLASDGAAYDYFGRSVSISGDYAIIGAYEDDDNGSDSGSAYIFKRDGESWSEQAKLVASDGNGGDYFGESVSISGDYAIIGARGDDDNGSDSGSAYIFKRDGASWSEQAKLLASDGAAYDYFGRSVSISGDYAIAGAYANDDNGYNSGSAYIFAPNEVDLANWDEVAKLTASDGAIGDWFGWSVSISGDKIIVGAYYDDDNGNNSGSAYIFNRDGTNWSEQAKLVASDGAEGDYFGSSVSIIGDYAIIGAYYDDDNGEDSGSAYIFKRNGLSWSEEAKLVVSDGAANDWFGWSVFLSSGYAIVGAYGDDDNGNNSGSAYIYSYSGGYICGTKWSDSDGDSDHDDNEEVIKGWRIYIDVNENGQFDDGEPNDITDANGHYSLMVPVGSWIVAEEEKTCWEQTYPGGGTYNVTLVENWQVAEGYDFGNVRSTEIHPSRWGQQQQDKLVASDGAADDRFSVSVSVSGDYAIVGAEYDDDNGSESGSAYIFTLNDINCGEWDEQAKLVASDGAASDYFGYSVSISGDKTIVGAYGDDDNGGFSGSAYIFKRNGTTWSEQAKLIASDAAFNDVFGWSVSISGDYAIIGATGDDDNGSRSGSAYIFAPNEVDPNNWDEVAKLTASDGAAEDLFGYSVSISGDYAIVGVLQDDDNGEDSGSAYIFKRDGTSWSEQAKLVASDGAAEDYFGTSVSISGNYAVVGVYGDDDNGNESGSAYIFKRDGTSWSEQVKLVASDGAASDYFGWSVSISGDYAIVGAERDDDNGSSSGSAYIFKRDGASWSEQLKLVASDGAASDWFGFSVSISYGYAIVGAFYDDDNGINSGSAYMFGKILCPSADLTGDCFVNFRDVAVLAGEWLQGGEEP
jgi:hypothetical protein